LRNFKDVSHSKVYLPVGDWVYVHVKKKCEIDEVLEVVKRAYERSA